MISSANGSQHNGPRTARDCSTPRTASSDTPVISGMAISAMISGSANQRSRTACADPGRGHRDQHQPADHRRPGDACPGDGALLQCAFGLHDQPGRAHQHVGHRQRQRDRGREQRVVPARAEAADVAARASSPATPTPASSRRRTARSQVCLCVSLALTRKSKATPRRVRPTSISATGRYSSPSTRPCARGKAISRMPDAEHQPGLVGVPERADGGDHHVLLGRRWRGASACPRRGRSRR